MTRWVDLHLHSTASDGTCSPAELVALAVNMGLCAMSLTDHDTTAGLAEAETAAKEHNLFFVRGCELAAQWLGHEFHFLGYFIPQKSDVIEQLLRSMQHARCERNGEIIHKLQKLGFDVTLAEVEKVAGGSSLGRPHMASLLIKRGYAHSVQEAFAKYLGLTGAAYVPRILPPVKELLETLVPAGITVSWAHPCLSPLPTKTLTHLAGLCAGWGLQALETFHSTHQKNQVNWCRTMAKRHGFLPTGGSDFHGTLKPHVQFGRVATGDRVDGGVLDAILEQRQEKGLWVT